jgi:RNA polymerase primary sigma factor
MKSRHKPSLLPTTRRGARNPALGLGQDMASLSRDPLSGIEKVLRAATTMRDLSASRDVAHDSGSGGEDHAPNRIEYGSVRESHPILHLYLCEIGQVPLLTEAEEQELVRRIRRGDEAAREQMIKANLRLVVHIARRHQNFGLPLLDLISEGNIGLMKAVDRFDPSHGRRLSSYAGIWITQRIRRALANQSKLIRLPVHQVERIFSLRKSSTQLYAELGREPTDEEIAQMMSLPESKIARLRSAALAPASLDVALGEDSSDTLASLITDETCGTPEHAAERRGEMEVLFAAVGSLSPREIIVLKQRFGLESGTEQTLEEVGASLGLTRERIRQIQNRALSKLRRRLGRTMDIGSHWSSFGK